ncbi:hypothetical protein MPSEU_000779600 [Mayamaea pseudoterrestris]|nr:hypothetical protein MPSEU_000779600 [Mayamaea pseudoterrestris]
MARGRSAKSQNLRRCFVLRILISNQPLLPCFGFVVNPPTPLFGTKRCHRITSLPYSRKKQSIQSKLASSFNEDNLEAFIDDNMDEYCDVVDDFGCAALESLVEVNDDNAGDEQHPREVYQWIRLEQNADPSVRDISDQQNVYDKIEEVKQLQQAKSGLNCNVYARHWQRRQRAAARSKDMSLTINGDAINGLTPKSTNTTFTIAQFNALAEGLSSGPDAKRPFPNDSADGHTNHTDKNATGYGGFTSVPYIEQVLDFSRRRWRLLEVLLKTYRQSSESQSLFDIIAIEEMDRYHGFFAPMLRLFGYDSFFAPKTRSPCLPLGYYSDGCALFWRTDKFKLISAKRHEFRVGSQVFILAVLQHHATNRSIVVAVTHLKAQASESNEKIRCVQVKDLLLEVSRCVSSLVEDTTTVDGDATSREHLSVPILFVGDLNADADCEFDESCVRERILHSDLLTPPLQSAYLIDPPPPSFYTTWKIRGTKETRRIIDYIFYSNLTCLAALQVPTDINDSRLPGLSYPSDHMLIAAEFAID